MWGFGTLTPLAAWALSGRPLESWALLAILAFCPLFAAFYPLTQLYQFEEDRRRGDRTLALVLGMRRSLQVALASTAAAFLLFFLAAAALPAGPRQALLLVPLAAWLAVLLPWLRNHAAMTPEQHQRGMYAALRAWAVDRPRRPRRLRPLNPASAPETPALARAAAAATRGPIRAVVRLRRPAGPRMTVPDQG